MPVPRRLGTAPRKVPAASVSSRALRRVPRRLGMAPAKVAAEEVEKLRASTGASPAGHCPR